MKLKFILAVFVFKLFVVSSILAQEKIPNGCLGVSFGSSPTTVKEIMAKKSGYPKGYSDDENRILTYNPKFFAGNPCKNIYFFFTNKKMFRVVIEITLYYDNENYETFMRIYKDICEKYGYTEIYSKKDIFAYYCAIWGDEKNSIILVYDTEAVDAGLTIHYVNKALQNEDDQKKKSEY